MNLNISLPESDADFVQSQVAAGNFSSSSEVVRAALQLMRQAERESADKLTWLREAWAAGVASGDGEKIDFAALKDAARGKLAARKQGG
jgi:antitoxin ParD1/3/4